jgi:phage tail-like protein
LAAFAPAARGRLRTPFDSGVNDCAWHRLYIEADVPPDTSLTIYAAISNDRTAPSSDAEDEWHPHHLGIVPNRKSAEPQAAWVSSPSEIPGQRGFTGRPIEKNRSGLFTVLLQKSDRPVRTMRGRFLHLSLELRGNLRSTPKIFALRAYAPRFSYQDKYLPALYRETLFSSEGGEPGPGRRSTPADFLGRFIANFEGILTPLEDSIASSWMLTDPRSAPSEALDWLGSWIGISFEPWYPAQSRRKQIQVAPELFRQRGTHRGLEQALDVATDGGVRAGRVIVVEDHWFRRTLQTVLGLEFDRDDPLLGRPVLSGNSKVGETLFLSEEGFAKKFLALFDASIQLSAADRRVVDEFFASLAFRVTVIIHDQASPEERKVVQRVAALEIPAHVSLRLREGDREFMLGLNSLLGVDSYLRADRPATPVEVDSSAIGGGGLLIRPPSFDPRLEGTS